MKTLIAITDVHLTQKNPASRTDSWEQAIFHVLDQVADLAETHAADGVLIAGDLFHSPRVSLQVIHRFALWCQRVRIVYTIPGNHDLVNDALSLLPRTPYGVLSACDVIDDVCQPRRAGSTVFAGVPYPPALRMDAWEMVGAALDQHFPDARYRVVLGHCYATDGPATDYFGDPVHAYADLVAATKATVIVLGHDHRDQGVVNVGGCYVVQLGAIERGAISLDEVQRQPKAAVIRLAEAEDEQTSVEVIALDVPPAAEVFDLEAHEARKDERTQVEAFVEGLKATLAEQTGMGLPERVQALDVPAHVRERVVRYLTEAEL